MIVTELKLHTLVSSAFGLPCAVLPMHVVRPGCMPFWCAGISVQTQLWDDKDSLCQLLCDTDWKDELWLKSERGLPDLLSSGTD